MGVGRYISQPWLLLLIELSYLSPLIAAAGISLDVDSTGEYLVLIPQ